MNIQGQTIQSHNHTITHTHTQQGTFNTDEKGGHTHTTNSQSTTTSGTGGAFTTDWIDINSVSHQTLTGIETKQRPNDSAIAGTGSNDWSKGYLRVIIPNHTHDYSHTHSTNSQGAHTHSVTISGSTKKSSNADSGSTGSTETRPDNYSYVIWKRIA